MPRHRRLVIWLLLAALIVPLPLGAALATGEPSPDAMMTVVDMTGHDHHSMATQDAYPAHGCCQDEAPMPSTGEHCEAGHCGACAAVCHVVASLPVDSSILGLEPDASLSVEHLLTASIIYPQVPHQPPRV